MREGPVLPAARRRLCLCLRTCLYVPRGLTASRLFRTAAIAFSLDPVLWFLPVIRLCFPAVRRFCRRFSLCTNSLNCFTTPELLYEKYTPLFSPSADFFISTALHSKSKMPQFSTSRSLLADLHMTAIPPKYFHKPPYNFQAILRYPHDMVLAIPYVAA